MKEGSRVRSNEQSLQTFDPEPGVQYNLEGAAHLTGVSRHSIQVYCKSGLVRPCNDEAEGMAFDEEAIYAIRRIEYLRGAHGINLAGIRMIFELMQEVHRLREEMRFHR